MAKSIAPMKRITIPDLLTQASDAMQMVNDIKGRMLAPEAKKSSPMFSLTQVAALCGLDKGQFSYRLSKESLPNGQLNKTGSRREFSLAQARQWVRSVRSEQLKPVGKRAVVVAVTNFKGGVTKTTTVMTLAQAFSLRGHKVLAIDCDPQGSLTTLFGISPDAEVQEEQTIAPLTSGTESSIRPSIQTTYWDGVDLVAAAPALFSAEFMLPARQMQEPDFKFYDVLNQGLEDIKDEYDIVIIDTSPSLSYLTINAIMCADGLIVPMPPNALDFASSGQFWSLFSDLAANLVESAGLSKTFDFINVLLSRVDTQDSASSVVRTWIAATYKDKLLPVEIPKTSVASSSSAEFGTVYDISKYEGNAKTLKRARDAYDRVADLLEETIHSSWAAQE